MLFAVQIHEGPLAPLIQHRYPLSALNTIISFQLESAVPKVNVEPSQIYFFTSAPVLHVGDESQINPRRITRVIAIHYAVVGYRDRLGERLVESLPSLEWVKVPWSSPLIVH